MSTLKSAGQPAKSPQTTKYVCINPDGGCDLKCWKCPYYVPESEAFSMLPDEDYIKSLSQRSAVRTLHKFNSWDQVSDQITDICRNLGLPAMFDLVLWRFADGSFWHNELSVIPAGSLVEVEWIHGLLS